MRTRPLSLAAVALVLLATSCAEMNKLAAAAIQKPRLEFRSVALSSADLEGVTLAFTYDLENPNAFGLDVAKVSYAMEVESARVVSGEVPGGLRIPASGKAPLTFTARLRFRDVPRLVEVAGQQRDIHYQLSGTVGLSTPVGVLDVPLSHQGTVKPPRLPRFSLDGLGLGAVSLSHVTVELRLRVENPNDFPVPGGRLDGAVSLGGKPLAEVDGHALGTLPRNGDGRVTIPVKIDVERAGRLAADLAAGRPVEVAVRGKADVGGLSVPLDLGGRFAGR
jgi:LEA14-like dessication related protein